MVWSCRCLTQSETGLEHHRRHSPGPQKMEIGSHHSIGLWPSINFYDFWQEVVEAYTWRQLTVITDKLVAIQGLANEIERGLKLLARPDTYQYGIWQAKLPFQLIWHSTGRPLARPAALRDIGVPSWSWASVDGPISFRRRGGDWSFIPDGVYERLTLEATGAIALRGPCERVFDLLVGTSMEERREAAFYRRWPLAIADGSLVGHAQTDNVERPVGPLYVVPLFNVNYRQSPDPIYRGTWCESLLPEPLEQFGYYRRIGVVYGGTEHTFQNAQAKDISIV